MCMNNKDHWYDGYFYDKFIAPNQDRMFAKIKQLIKPDSRIIDIGCGTGRMEFFLADKCSTIVGIDLSEKNINTANKNLSRSNLHNVSFFHGSVFDYFKINNEKFDYAVATYVIHEMNEEDRFPLIKKVAEFAGAIIIGEYLVPRPKGFWNLLNGIVEFAAGREHNANFKNFVKNNGVLGIAQKLNMKIIHEIKNQPATSHLVVMTNFDQKPSGVK